MSKRYDAGNVIYNERGYLQGFEKFLERTKILHVKLPLTILFDRLNVIRMGNNIFIYI